MMPVLMLSAIAIAGGLAAMTLRNVIHCVLALAVVFAGLAAIFLVLGAQFAGLAQILVYVGAVAILTVFAVLLTRTEEPDGAPILARGWALSLAVAACVFGLFASSILRSAVARRALPPQPETNVRQLGEALMSRYIVPLEVAGLLLTAALVGAVLQAQNEKQADR